MTNKYNFVSITPVFKIRRFLLLLIFASLGISSIIYATNPNQTVQKATGVSKAAAEINPGSDPFVILSSSSISLFATADIPEVVQVTSNTNWSVNSDQPWLKVTPVSGNENGTLTFKADGNISGAERTANVTVRSTGLADQIIVVTQMPDISSITFTSSASTKSLSVQLQFKSNGTVYIDWGDGARTSYPATTLGGTYTTPLDLSGTPVKIYGMGITNISLSSNYLTTLVVTQCTDLSYLDISRNSLSEIDLRKNTRLSYLDASSNNLKGLDVSNNTGLTILSCFSNKINSLDISKNIALSKLYCNSNMLTMLDVSNNPLLTLLYCNSNSLNFITLPQPKAGYPTYKYAPQAFYPVSVNGNVVDLSYLLSVKDISNIIQKTTYSWYKKTGTLLVSGTDYTESEGVFTFLKNPSDSLYCTMINAALPGFAGANVLRTVNLKVQLVIPTLTTEDETNISTNMATGKGTLTDTGIPSPTSHGFCWNTTGTPIVTEGNNDLGPTSAIGSFFKDMTGLLPATTYYVRAYATNLAGTGYGTVITFTTIGLPPLVRTDSITKIGITKARGYGKITDVGAPNPTEHGVVWSTSPAPTVDLLTKTTLGPASLPVTFTSDITGLTAETTYYVRAYATNSVGTGYGDEVVFFKTLSPIINTPIPSSLTDFKTTIGTASPSQIFIIRGLLSDNLNIAPPAGYELRKKGTINFGANISFPPSPSEIVEDTIEIRIERTAPLGVVSGNVVCSSTGAASQFVSLEGFVSPAQLTASDPVITSYKVYDGDSKAVVVKGVLSGVEIIDDGNVILSATASYNDASVGKTKTITVKYTISGSAADKYLPPVDFVITTGEIAGKPLTVTDPTVTTQREYNGTTTTDVVPGTLSGFDPGDIVNISATANYDNADEGTGKTITVTYTLTGISKDIYAVPIDYTLNTGEINPKPLTAALADLTTKKEYDGTLTAKVIAGALSGVETADVDDVVLLPIASYDNINAGTGKTITVAYTLSGNKAHNYLAPVDYTVTNGEITGKPLTASAPAITEIKPYDGSPVAIVAPGVLSGVEAIDAANVVLEATALYDTEKVGKLKTIIVRYTLSGDEAYKYLPPVDYVITTGEISKKPLTTSGYMVNLTKEYDGNTGTNVTPGPLTGVVDAEIANVILEASASFYDATIGSNKNITITYWLSGPAADNYTAPVDDAVSNGEIKPKRLTVSLTSPTILTTIKPYDGNADAAVTEGIVEGVLAADDGKVILEATASYEDANSGTDKEITVTYTITGPEASKYLPPNPEINTTGEITGKPLVIDIPDPTLIKPYDGTNIAVVDFGGIISGVDPGDEVVLHAKATYVDANVGKGKIITLIYFLTNAAGDAPAPTYTVPPKVVYNTGEITPIALTALPHAITLSKPYDSTTRAYGDPVVIEGMLDADKADYTLILEAYYDNKNAGTGKTITVSYKTTSGLDLINYSPPPTYTVPGGIITPAPLIVTAVSDTVTYNGTILSTKKPKVGTLYSGDAVSQDAIQVYDDSKVGVAHVMTASDIVIQNGAGDIITTNYDITYNHSVLPGIIEARQLTASDPTITLQKVYNGNTGATASPGTLSNVVPVDVSNVGLVTNATYDDATVRTDKTITVNYSLNGSAAGNYTPPSPFIVTNGVITQAP